MYWDAEAYAEGICNSAAGSSIETLVDTINETLSVIKAAKPEDSEERVALENLAGNWKELREAIIEREQEQGEDTVFHRYEEDEDDE